MRHPPKDLSDRYLKSLSPPEDGRDEHPDAKTPGLTLRLSKHKASWMFEKRIKDGPKRKHTLGAWPKPVSLADARSQALILAAEAAQGIDRVEEAREQKLAEEAAKAALVTVGAVLDTYDTLHLSGLRTRDERRRQLTQILGPLHDVPITSLERKDLQAAIDAKAKEGRKPYANRLRAAIMAFTRWAWQRGYISEDIAAGLPKATTETARERVLSVPEVQAVWAASAGMGVLWGPFIRVMLLTCQRRGEILNLRWQDIDLEKRRITLPGSRTKNGKPHVTHLSDPAFAELTSLHEGRISDLVFTTTGTTPVSGIGKAKARLDGLLGDDFEPWRLHDIRTAFATAMAEAGVPEGVADRVLNHSASGSAPSAVARVYNQAEMLPQRAAALERWADVVTGGSGKVVRMLG